MWKNEENTKVKRKIAIFSDAYNGPQICASALKFGITPYLFVAKKPAKDMEIEYYVADPNAPIEIFAEEIKSEMGDIPDAVICCIEQYCTNVARYAEMIGVAVNKSEVYEKLRNKRKMKQIWMEKNVLTAKAIFCEKISQVPFDELNYPVIIKPTLGAASAGVRICDSGDSLKKQCQQILRFNLTTLKSDNRKSGFLIEEYISGEEYSVDTVWYNGKPYLDGIMDKGNPQGPNFPDRLYLINENLSSEIRHELLRVSHEAVLAAGVKNGATHTEIRMMNGIAYVIEAALRPGAGGCFYGLFKEALNAAFYDAFVLVNIPNLSEEEILLLEKMKNAVFERPCRRKYWYNIGYKGSGLIKGIKGVEDICRQPYVDVCKIHKKIGDYLLSECDSFTYFGWLIGSLETNSFERDYDLLTETEKMLSIEYQ